MKPSLTNDTAYIIGFACEAVLWGAYFVLFSGTSIAYATRHRSRRVLALPLLIAHIALFLLATTHFALEFSHFYTHLASNGVEGYANETGPLFGADILMSLLDFVGDCVLIYRCWILWKYNIPIIILPFLAALCGFVCIMEVAHLTLTIDPSAPTPSPYIVPLGIAGYALPLCTNVMVTILITGRLWYDYRPNREYLHDTHSGVLRVIIIIVESGLLYLAVQLVYLVLFSLQHPAEQTVGIMAVQIYGIAPTLIIARSGRDKRRSTTKSTMPTMMYNNSTAASDDPQHVTTRSGNYHQWDTITEVDKADNSSTDPKKHTPATDS
ncbi:hypothetical protein WOLCODRAFT_18850 [Wolfiporia cocos MD-104 SS10]|uniref:Family A G protein-coupled receptor-like protein n=1 Tax=Wolfiporia cocos (strain MD-104) TaxID=742152 RepID=A0A2H3K5H8_WOLCO|nr:hypothetical protein WOLCODRAFT_18850 [Wolfiporia cocos MD-104 SS10]